MEVADCSENSQDGDNEDDECEELIENEELAELPEELADLRGKTFGTEQALLDELEKRGFGDLKVVLWKDTPYMICPSEEHNRFTAGYVSSFLKRCGRRWGHCTATNQIYLANGTSRHVDISYWGYPRCNSSSSRESRELGFDFGQRTPIPDVILQFCWRNTLEYETRIMNDMMNQGLECKDGPLSTDRPRVGYLIAMKFSKKKRRKMVNGGYTTDVAGVDIYRLPHGTTVDQARDPNNPAAQYWTYKPGDSEVYITIRHCEDLGMPTFGITHYVMRAVVGLFSGREHSGDDEYKIKASEIYTMMSKLHKALT